ncbi:MAG: hypothetical protein JJ891_07345 [Rhizobiaceae bacterium]|jgi:hypothetical protein|nr:hypothetical protein [Rhizobiaceae bacterium]
MSIIELIEDYELRTQQIVTAIEKDDEAEILRLDPLLDGAFKKILSHASADSDTRLLQVECLLDFLLPEPERTENQKQVCNKLLSIIPPEPAEA